MMTQEYNSLRIEELPTSPRRPPLREVHGQNNTMHTATKLQELLARLLEPGTRNDSDKLYQILDEIKELSDFEHILYDKRGGATQERSDNIVTLERMHQKCLKFVNNLVRPHYERHRDSEVFEVQRRYDSQDREQISYAEHSSRFRSHHKHPPTRQRAETSSDEEFDNDENDYSRQNESRILPQSPRNDERRERPRMKLGRNTLSKNRFRKTKPGQKALREIRHYQQSTDLLLAKAPFRRAVVGILRKEATTDDIRIRRDALDALQEAAESFMVQAFESSSLLSTHAKRKTLMDSDIKLYRRLCLKY